MWARIGMLVLVATMACYAPSPSAGAPCGPEGLCPVGLTCSADNRCTDREGPIGDAADPDVSSDGETTPDAPRKRWKLISHEGKVGPSVGITPTQQGNTILVGVETGNAAGATAVTDDAGNVYELIPQSRATANAFDIGIELWRAADARAGATQISAAGPSIHSLVEWEVQDLAGVIATETRSDQASSTMPSGAPITTTRRGQFVVSIIIVQFVTSGLTANSAFTTDETAFGNGWVHLTDDDAPAGDYQPQWIQNPSGTSCATSAVLDHAD